MATEQVDLVLARLAALEAKFEALEARNEPPSASDPAPDPERPVTRRRLIGMAGAAAAGAVGATALAATPAAAANGDNIVIGAANTGTTPLSTSLTSNTTAGTFIVSNTAAGLSLRGESNGGQGVSGLTTSGTGVGGEASGTGGIGVRAMTSGALPGYALSVELLSGGESGAHMRLAPHPTVTGPPTTGTHGLGELWMDLTGTLFQCVAATPGAGTWVRQSPLVTLASPVRIYYSLTFPDPPLGNGLERSVTVTNGTTIPHSASAVLTNLAVTPAGADGFLAMFKDGTVWPGTSNVNFTAGQFASNNATSAVETSSGTGKVKIRCGGASVHFVIDVFGYYP